MKSDSSSHNQMRDFSRLPTRVSTGPVARQDARSLRQIASSSPSADGLTPDFLWRVFCTWWRWTAPLGILLALAAAGVVWYLHVLNYEAAALIKIESQVPFIAFEQGVSRNDGDRYVQTQIELLRSPVVLGPVLSRPEVASIPEIRQQVNPTAFLHERLTVKQVGRSELYEVAYTSHSAEDAATFVNAVVAEYLISQDREDRQRSQIVIDVLEKEKLDRGVKVEELRKRVADLTKELSGKDPFGQGVVMDVTAFSSATSIYQSLTEADVSIEMLKAELQALSNAPIVAADKAAAAGLLELEISNRDDVRQLEARIAVVRGKIAEVKAKPRPRIRDTWKNDPEYLQLSEQLRQVNADLQNLKEVTGRALMNQRLEQRKAEQLRLISSKGLELSSMRKKHEVLARALARHLDELKTGGVRGAELEFARAELQREQNVFELIASRKLALQTEMRAPARVSLMKSAKVPSVALEMVPYKLIMLASLISLTIPLALAVAYEAIIRRVDSADQLAKESLLPVLGEVSCFPLRRKQAAQHALPAAQQRQLFAYTESIDSLRTNLMLTENLGIPNQPKAIAICSAASGEGKTSVATSLAMSIAEATKLPTLVLDADLRSPDVGKYLDVPNAPGLIDWLVGNASIEQATHRVGTTQAYVLPAGKQRVNPHHILQGSRINELLDTLRPKFSTIVIDTPPVLAASESLVYAKAADLVVLCSMADVSRAGQVRVAVDRLQSTGANIVGAVISGVPFRQYINRYGTYAQSGN